MTEQTLVLIKPDGVERKLVGDIISRFEKGGLKVVKLEGPVDVDEKLSGVHYQLDDYDYVQTLGHVDVSGLSEVQKKEIYDKNYRIVQNLQKFLQSGPIFKMILEGENGVALVRSIVGKTNPADSPAGTIRGDLGDDSYEQADNENRSVRNLVHASGTVEEAKREIGLWFPD